MESVNQRDWGAIATCAVIAVMAVLGAVGTTLVTQPYWASLDAVRSVHGQPVTAGASVANSRLAQSTAAGVLGRSSVVMRGRVDLDGSSVPAVSLATLDPPAASGFEILRGAWPASDGEVAVSPALAELYRLEVGAPVDVAGRERLIVGVVEDRNSLGAIEIVTTSQVLHSLGQVTQLVVLSQIDVDDLRMADQGVAGARVPWTTTPAVRSGSQHGLVLQLLTTSAVLVVLALLAAGASRLLRRATLIWRSGGDAAAACAAGFAAAAGVLGVGLAAIEASLHRRLHWTFHVGVTIGAGLAVAVMLAALLAARRRGQRHRSPLAVIAMCSLAVGLVLGFAAIEPQPLAEPFNRHTDGALSSGLQANTVLVGDQADLTEFAGSVDLAGLQDRIRASLPADQFEVVGLTIAAGTGSGEFVTAQSTRAATPLGLATQDLFSALRCADSFRDGVQLAGWSGLDLDPSGYTVRGELIASATVPAIECHALASPLIPDLWTFTDSTSGIAAGVVVSGYEQLHPDDIVRLGLLTHPVALTVGAADEAPALTVGRYVALVSTGVALGVVLAKSGGRDTWPFRRIGLALVLGAGLCLVWTRFASFTPGLKIPLDSALALAVGAFAAGAWVCVVRSRASQER